MKLTVSSIYPVDVAKTVYQKALLSAGSSHVPRPAIQVFQAGAYRGMCGFCRCGSDGVVRFADLVLCLAGLGVSVARSCILNMIFFSNFEMVKKRINALDT